jgi:hypothetical protein
MRVVALYQLIFDPPALDGSLARTTFRTDPYFGLAVQTSVPGVEPHILIAAGKKVITSGWDGATRELSSDWWAGQDSNLQPDRYERPALTIELPARTREALSEAPQIYSIGRDPQMFPYLIPPLVESAAAGHCRRPQRK